MALNKDRYPSNSIAKKSRKRPKQVARGQVVGDNKPFLLRIFGENTGPMAEYVLWDILVPALKSTITEMIAKGAEILFYGDERPSRLRRDRGRSYVSYTNYARSPRREPHYPPSRSHKRGRHQMDDILIGDHAEADMVLANLVELIDTYGVATVGDFYDLVGVESDWPDQNWGWENLASASVVPVRNGYILDLPRPYALEN